MGYVGGGMAPIDVTVRPKGVGLGFGAPLPPTPPPSPPSQTADESLPPVAVNAWKRGAARPARTQYITALDSGAASAPKELVVDLRAPTSKRTMPELFYNVRLLVDLLRVELVELDTKQGQRRAQLAALDAEHERVRAQGEAERERLVRVERVRGLVDECGRRVRERRIDLAQVCALFGALRTSYAREYELFRLSRLVHTLVAPLLRERLRNWAPLADDDPLAVAGVFRAWRDVLLPDGDDDDALLVASDAARHDARLFQQLLDEHVLPPLRVALMRTWRPQRNSSAALALLLAWRDVLPRRTFASLLETMVVPRLERALADSGTDALTMHAWLAPWQTLLGAAFEPLLPAVTQQLMLRGAELDTALDALHAWTSAGLGDAALQRLLERVVAALERRLRAVPLDPAAPDSSALEAALRWFDFAPLPVARLVHVLEEHFFAPWFAVTRQWLAGEPDFAELRDWYAGWKQLFPAPLVDAAPRLRTLFNHALDLLKCAFARLPLPDAPALPTRARLRAQAAEQTSRFGVADDAADDDAFLTSLNEMREAVSEMAAERGVSFQRAARQYDNRDAYRLGSTLVRFENGLLLERLATGEWRPASIDQLLDRATKPATKPTEDVD